MDLPGRVLAAIRAHRMVPPGGRVLVALSGGPDSVGLLHLLRLLEDEGHLQVAGIAHVNHRLRPEARDDEAFCRDLAASLNLPACVESADVAALAREWRTSIEAAGRRLRYSFLNRTADAIGADVAATGHTEDDQAETFLLQLLRGAGPRGLGGIRPVAGRVCRPLLEVSRADVRTWLEARGLPFRDDASNRDPAFLRNRVRAELLPLLARRFSPGVTRVLAREAAIAQDDEAFLEEAAAGLARDLMVLRDAEGDPLGLDAAADQVHQIELDAAMLAAQPRALSSRVARLALGILATGRFISHGHIAGLLGLLSQPAGTLSLPGQQAVRTGSLLVLRRRSPRPFVNSFRVSLSIPGEVSLGQYGWQLSAEWPNGPDTAEPGERGLIVPVRADRVAAPLAVRSRRPGDRFHPPGMGGRSRKLQDYFVDRKIPRERRDLVPLVVDREDRIVWVVGHGLAEEVRVTAPSQGVLLLKARRLGGPG
jgi:tRNA(Ile)-lysidine synthase